MTEETLYFERYNVSFPDGEAVLFNGLNDDAYKKKGMRPISPYGIFIKDENGCIVGGVEGITMYGCLYVDMLWLREDLRHKGLGVRLMDDVEAIGRQRQCTFATVNTMDWEALPFYQSLGFAIEFIREGYENESKMYLLRKAFIKI
jgi:ribosomal protein S18 acetylase RimI-like enzyme